MGRVVCVEAVDDKMHDWGMGCLSEGRGDFITHDERTQVVFASACRGRIVTQVNIC